MNLGSFVKSIQDIMRNDAGVNGDAQRLEQLVWILFLKVYDDREQEWEFEDESYVSIIPENLRWRNWAIPDENGHSKTGDELLDFVNTELFPTLKNLEIDENTPIRHSIVKSVFEDGNNYMKNGTLLRQVVDVIAEADFNDHKESHAFGEVYETLLKSLQSAGNAGEFYTPRAVTEFIINMIKPTTTDKLADFACGTGGFLTSALKYLDKDMNGVEDLSFSNNLYGVEKKPLPYLLCITNMLIHGVNNPNIHHANTLEIPVQGYSEKDKFDIIVMNPPYGGSEQIIVQQNFPKDLRGSETADLFMSVIMYRLKQNGKAAVILPDGFLFGNDNTKLNIKKKLLTDFNLHTIIRLPGSVFAPYTSITTNILFFDKTEKTKETWIYRLDMPAGYKNFSKTKPMKLEHFAPAMEWWNNRTEIMVDEFPKAKKFTPAEFEVLGYNFDQCGTPKIEEEILPPKELLAKYHKQRTKLDEKIDKTLAEITNLLGFNVGEK